MSSSSSREPACIVTVCAGCSRIPHPQDQIHGLGMRVHNTCNISKTLNSGKRCTVCRHESHR